MLGFDAKLEETGRVSVPRCKADLFSTEELSKQSWHKLQEVDFGTNIRTRTVDGMRITHAYDRKDST